MNLTQSFILSLQVAVCAVVLVTAIAIPLAFALNRSGWRIRGLIEAGLTIPLVLPPTVVGYLIILVLGRQGVVGRYLDSWLHYSIMFNWHGAVLAAAVVALPLVYLPARSAFACIDRDMEDAARLCGAGTLALFWHVSLPVAARGIAAGVVLAFARTMGEFGATIMVMGDTARYRTLPLTIYEAYSCGDRSAATFAMVPLIAVSLAVILVYSRALPRLCS